MFKSGDIAYCGGGRYLILSSAEKGPITLLPRWRAYSFKNKSVYELYEDGLFKTLEEYEETTSFQTLFKKLWLI